MRFVHCTIIVDPASRSWREAQELPQPKLAGVKSLAKRPPRGGLSLLIRHLPKMALVSCTVQQPNLTETACKKRSAADSGTCATSTVVLPAIHRVGSSPPNAAAHEKELLHSKDGPLCRVCGPARYNPTTGAFIDFFANTGSDLYSPLGIAFGPDNNLYIATGITNVMRFNYPTGPFMDFFVPGGGGGLTAPFHLTFGAGPSSILHTPCIAIV